MTDLVLRPATEADVPAITAIYNDVIRTSDAIWLHEEVTEADRLTWLRSLREDDACLVAVAPDATVAGYVGCFAFRAKTGYWPTVEITIMVADGWRGTGAGSLLLEAIVDHAGAVGRRVVVAGVDGGNEGSRRFHERHGFREVARMPGVGRKRGLPVDLVLLQRDLPGPDRRST